MRIADRRGQAAIEAIAGAMALLALAVVIVHIFALLAASAAVQAETRDAAIDEAMTTSTVAVVKRSRPVPGAFPGLRASRLTARAAIRERSK